MDLTAPIPECTSSVRKPEVGASCVTGDAVLRIPRRLHFIWYQGWKRLPAEFRPMVQSWVELLPDWEVFFWDKPQIEELIASLPDSVRSGVRSAFEAYILDIQRIDLSKLLILYVLGGVYSDVDVVALKRIEPLLSGHRFYISREHEPELSFCNAFMASEPAHSLTLYLIRFLLRLARTQGEHQTVHSMVVNTTGPDAITRALMTFPAMGQGVCADLDPDNVYPIPWQAVDCSAFEELLEEIKREAPSSYAAHLWAGSWKWSDERMRASAS